MTLRVWLGLNNYYEKGRSFSIYFNNKSLLIILNSLQNHSCFAAQFGLWNLDEKLVKHQVNGEADVTKGDLFNVYESFMFELHLRKKSLPNFVRLPSGKSMKSRVFFIFLVIGILSYFKVKKQRKRERERTGNTLRLGRGHEEEHFLAVAVLYLAVGWRRTPRAACQSQCCGRQSVRARWSRLRNIRSSF